MILYALTVLVSVSCMNCTASEEVIEIEGLENRTECELLAQSVIRKIDMSLKEGHTVDRITYTCTEKTTF
jgi:hypothetical protein